MSDEKRSQSETDVLLPHRRVRDTICTLLSLLAKGIIRRLKASETSTK
jgi:hypothetical protein